MKTMNKIELIGYLGKDPVISVTEKGTKKAMLRLATDQYRKDTDGKVQRIVTWHDVVAWEKLAETIPNEYIKGSHVRVEGEVVYHTYPDLTGHIRYVTEIRASRLMNLDR